MKETMGILLQLWHNILQKDFKMISAIIQARALCRVGLGTWPFL